MTFFRDNLLWGAFAVFGVASVGLAFFMRGGMHGLYADDYVYRYFGSDVVKTAWTPTLENVNYRVLAIWLAPLLARGLPEMELPLRVGLLALHGLNVFLIGWLAKRLTGSRGVAIVAALAFLIPLFAYEPLLWFSASVFYQPSLLLLLTGFHLILYCDSLRKFYLVAGAVLVWTVMLLFIESGLLIPLLTPAMMLMMARRGKPPDRRAVALALGVTYVIALTYVVFVLRDSSIVAVHGKTTLDVAELLTLRFPQVVASVAAYFGEWLPRGIFADALWLGTRAWMSSFWFWILVIAFGVGLGLIRRETTRQWTVERADNSLALLGIGLAWFALALAPVLFISGLGVSSRVMLFPSAGLALAAAGLVGWLMDKAGARRNLVWNAVLVVLAVFVFSNALALAGILRVYQLRWARDQEQLTALRDALPTLPPKRVWILAHALDQTIVQPEFGRVTGLENLLYALFDTPWAADRALWLAYGSERIELIDKDNFGKSHVVGVELDAAGAQVQSIVFQGTIQIQTVPVTHLLAFTYRANGFGWLDPLTLTHPEKAYRVSLPMIEQMRDVPRREAKLGIEEMR